MVTNYLLPRFTEKLIPLDSKILVLFYLFGPYSAFIICAID